MFVNRNRLISIIGIIEILIIYFAFCISTISHQVTLFEWLAVFLFGIAAVIYCRIFNWSLQEPAYFEQIRKINIVLVMLFAGLLLRDIRGVHFVKYQKIVLLILLITTFWCEGFAAKTDDVIGVKSKIKELKKFIQNNGGVIFVLLLFLIFSVYLGGTPYRWDSRLYYETCQNLNMFSISNLAIYGHIAQSFGVMMKIGTVLLGSTELAAYAGNVILAMLSIFAFYNLLRYLFPNGQMMEILLAVSIYAFSPYVLGLVNYLSLDYYCACVFPIMVYVTISEKWIYHILCGAFFCFTKEPAIVIYCVFCFIWLIYQEIGFWKKDKNFSFKRIITTSKYWYMGVIILMWLTTYVLLGPWSAGEGGFVLDFSYILDKLKVMYVFNFAWLFSIFCFFSIVVMLKRKEKKLCLCFGVIVIPLLAFTVFSCMFKTVMHYRYNAIVCYSISIMTVTFILNIKRRVIKQGILFLLTILVFLSSYMTMDPISKVLFQNVNTGSGYMLSTSSEGVLGDATIYNKQALWSENLLNNIVEDCVDNGDVIVIYTENEKPYYFDGLCEFGYDSKKMRSVDLYWDLEKKERTGTSNFNTVPLEIFYVTNENQLIDLVEDGDENTTYSYIVLEDDDMKICEKIQTKYRIIDETKYELFNWSMNQIRFSARR